MKEDMLRQIGLSDSEKKVYLALLELGDSTRGDIVNRSGVAGSKVYELLEKLQERGLVSIYLKDKVKHFKATNPNQILAYLEEKKKEVLSMEKEAKLLLPALLAKYNSSKENQEVELISGMRGLEMVFREQVNDLSKGETCYVIGGTWGTGEIEEERVQNFFEKIHLMREEKGIHTKMLFNKKQQTSTEALYSSKKYPRTTTRYLDHSAPVAINVYNDKTIILIFSKKVISIYIKSREVADSFIEYFNLLWNTAKK